MTVITTRITVSPDGRVAVATPLPAGEHEAQVTLDVAGQGKGSADPRGAPSRVLALPVHDGPWDDQVSLRREDLYGDRGR